MSSTSNRRLTAPISGLVGALVALAIAGCGHSGGGPYLSASWIGTDTGKVAGSAVASWCPVANRLEVTAVSQDAGFGVVIYPQADLATGDYPVFDPGIDSVHRPGASGAVRWFTEQQVKGYQSDSGLVTLTRSGTRVQLRFSLRMSSINGHDSIRAKGKATGLALGVCIADSVPNGSPKQ